MELKHLVKQFSYRIEAKPEADSSRVLPIQLFLRWKGPREKICNARSQKNFPRLLGNHFRD